MASQSCFELQCNFLNWFTYYQQTTLSKCTWNTLPCYNQIILNAQVSEWEQLYFTNIKKSFQFYDQEITQEIAKKVVPTIMRISVRCSPPWGVLVRILISCRVSTPYVLVGKLGSGGVLYVIFFATCVNLKLFQNRLFFKAKAENTQLWGKPLPLSLCKHETVFFP